VDPRRPKLSKLASTEVTVLAVSSGAATAEELAQVAVVADEAGRRITGVVLADPDDLDRTSGRVFPPDRTTGGPPPARLATAGQGGAAADSMTSGRGRQG
jgi:hypothetical protein